MKQLHNVESAEVSRSASLEQLWGLAVVLSDQMERGLAERGLTLARAGLLWQLQQDGPATQQSLSRSLRVTPRNITGLVDALEADGLAARRPHPSDRRATVVALTDKGANLARALKRDQDSGAQYFFNDVTPAELKTFDKVVERLMQRLRSAIGETDRQAM
ncbi:MAG TPA: MarR family transcriptional regulator [Candidatus Dormibacteraeota bacterium]|nr:MarR family transcriptional regulator [Candidatus Dormibacteraeota bacterium]